MNGFHGPAADRQVAGLAGVQHPVSDAHLTSPPSVLRAAGLFTQLSELMLKQTLQIISAVLLGLRLTLETFFSTNKNTQNV